MANTFFRFKQFTVHQDDCAMKVCTDACVFGGWTAEQLKASSTPVQHLLDIGAGTGLLSLMVAQAMDAGATIDAVEIDDAAARQAEENFRWSPWQQQLTLHHQAIQTFEPANNRLYDFIFTNPPFFENDLPSKNDKRNLALHSAALTLQELLTKVDALLQPDGKLAVLLPYQRGRQFISLAETFGLFPQASASLKQTSLHSHFRIMLLLGRTRPETAICSQSVAIKDNAGNYTGRVVELLQDYYLYL